MFSSKPNYEKLRVNLRLSLQRLRLLEKKKTELALKSRKEIGDYIAAGKEERARIRVEHIIREDYMVEALEIVELFCDLLLARFGLIKSMARIDEGLDEAMASVIWVSLRISGDIPEMKEIVKQLSAKYGKEYVDMCKQNDCENVNAKLKHKLSHQSPPKALIENYMVEIARGYNVKFEPDPLALMGEDIPTPLDHNLIDIGAGPDRKFPPPGGPGPGNGGGHFPVATANYPGPIPSYPPSQSQLPYPHHDGAAFLSQEPSCPVPNQNAIYPPDNGGFPTPPGISNNPPSGDNPPPLPSVPPAGGLASGPHPALPSYHSATKRQPSPPPAYNTGANANLPTPPVGPARTDSTLPDLPSVPLNDLNTPANSFGGSAGGEDVDFDDLTRRFEELKRRK